MSEALSAFYDGKQAAYGPWTAAESSHSKLARLVGTGRRVLDVGCGPGHLGALLRQGGNTVLGVDVSAAAVAEAGPRLDQALVLDLESGELPFPASSFDVVLCADILEHVFDPDRLLRRLCPLLRPDGHLVASIPNVGHYTVRLDLLRGRFEYREIGILDSGHVRFFTQASAERLLDRAGLDILARDLTLSVPDASPWTRRVIRFCQRLSPARQLKLAPLIAVQFLFVARPRPGSLAG